MRKVLTIAGSDSGGGAGIQADLKAIAARGCYGTSAITALTAQNTTGVFGVVAVESAFVAQQIDVVMTDIGADAWKVGMLANAAVIAAVAERARHYAPAHLVLDPVMVAKGGDALLEPTAADSLAADLLPLATVITPNRLEAEALSGMAIGDLAAARTAAAALHRLGPEAVIIKGGHLGENGDAVDVVFDGRQWAELSAARIDTPNTHGTGCTFASALAAELAQGASLLDAAATAKAYVTAAVTAAANLSIGGGHGPLDHFLSASVPVDMDLVSVRNWAVPTVLFACVHNAGRSQMAAAWLDHLAGGRAHAIQGGSAPADGVNPVVAEAMAELGIALGGQPPRAFTEADVRAADVVVTLGCGDECPFHPGKRYEDWIVDDPAGADLPKVRQIRDELGARVRRLIEELGV